MSGGPRLPEGLFETGAAGPRLLGVQCLSCGRSFFPKPPICLDCLSDRLQGTRLSSEGTLECFTTVHMPALNISPPYCVGYVRLPEKLRIFAPIEAGDAMLRVGMTMRLADYRLGRGAEKAPAYCFVPAQP